LESRARRLDEGLKKAQQLAHLAPVEVPDPEELEEMEEAEREHLDELLAAATLAGNADQVRDEIAELKSVAVQAQSVEDAGCEAKLSRLRELLHEGRFFDQPTQRLLIFTEFKDTLDYLVTKLAGWGFKVGFIHGRMAPGARDQPGSRLHAEQQFRDGEIQVLVATEAAGEGINLQCCHILFNYDIPWNPNRLEQRMGRIHRYGQTEDCLISNFVATNTIEGQVLRKLLEKLQEIRDALDDDAVFNVVGEVLPAAHIERILRQYYAGDLGDADLEDRLLKDVDETNFRSICQNALEGLAAKKLNLDMLIERRAKAQECRLVPESIAWFLTEAAEYVPLPLKPVPKLPHAFDPPKTPLVLRRYESEPDWKLPRLVDKYPRCTTDRETAEKQSLEWVTPGHSLFESVRRHTLARSRPELAKGACFYSVHHDRPYRIDFFRARVVDGLGQTVHERLFALQVSHDGSCSLQEPGVLGNLTAAPAPAELPDAVYQPEPAGWLHQNAFKPFLEEVESERVQEVERIAAHIELSLTELLQKADDEIGRAATDVEQNLQGAEGRLAQAEARHSELLARRDKRRQELERQRSLSIQAVERITSVLVLPHPDREAPEVRRLNLRPDPETEAIAMKVVIDHERSLGRQVFDVHKKNLGYDVTSLDLNSGELRLIEVKGIGAAAGTVVLTPNERWVAQDRRDCYWLYVVLDCKTKPTLQEVPDPARFPWQEVVKVEHYYLWWTR